jgi:hypothetical protein
LGLPSAEHLAAGLLTIVIFGPGFGESIVLRATGESGVEWGVVDSARRERYGERANPALDLLVANDARPALVVLTHPHEDHCGGMPSVIERARPDATIACIEPLLSAPSPFAPSEDPDDAAAVARSQTQLAHQAITRAWQSGSPKWSLVQGEGFDFAGWRLAVLHPARAEVDRAIRDYGESRHVNLNDLSAALLLEREEHAIVLGADCDDAAWTAVAQRVTPSHLRHTRPVKVPHHGSKNALHPVLIDYRTRDEGRIQVVTPFPKSGRLPRFDDDQGVERLVAAAGSMHLTAMPVGLVPTRPQIALGAIRGALETRAFEGDEALTIQLEEPGGTAQLAAGRRDPHETWIMLNVHSDGRVEATAGSHALQVTA